MENVKFKISPLYTMYVMLARRFAVFVNFITAAAAAAAAAAVADAVAVSVTSTARQIVVKRRRQELAAADSRLI